MSRRLVFVCQGKKCARACDHDLLLRALSKVADVQIVRCQGICHGTVVAVPLGRRLEWFERIDSAKLSIRLQRAVGDGSRKHLPASLRKRRLKRMAGKEPRHR